jgi:hypothetical protein
VDYEWDEKKRLINLGKHGMDFMDADLVFEAPVKITVAAAHCRRPIRRFGGSKRTGIDAGVLSATANSALYFVAGCQPAGKEALQ